MTNTVQKGSVRYIVFKEKSRWYAVALEFNIVEEGDDPREVLFLLFEAIRGYVESAKKSKIRTKHILNQTLDKEYEKLWNDLHQSEKEKVEAKIPFPVFAFGEQSLAAT